MIIITKSFVFLDQIIVIMKNDDIGFYNNLINAQNSKPINLVMYDPFYYHKQKKEILFN